MVKANARFLISSGRAFRASTNDVKTSCCIGPICCHRQLALLMTLNKHCKYGPVQCFGKEQSKHSPSKPLFCMFMPSVLLCLLQNHRLPFTKACYVGVAASCVSVQVVSIIWIQITGNACCIDATIKVTLVYCCFSACSYCHVRECHAKARVCVQGTWWQECWGLLQY